MIIVVEGILLELQSYVKTLENKFLPFKTLEKVIEDEFCKTKLPEMGLFRNKLIKYSRQNLFAQYEAQISIINKYIDEERKGEDEHMFHSLKSPYNKLAPRTIEKIVCDIGKRANINQKLTPHILRHTFASLTLQRGAKLQTIQKLLGHESITTTQIYAKDSVDNIIHDYNSNITF